MGLFLHGVVGREREGLICFNGVVEKGRRTQEGVVSSKAMPCDEK